MMYLTEAEFDRRYLVKKVVARTILRQAAEEEPVRATELIHKALDILSSLPHKNQCRSMCCEHCNGQTIKTVCEYADIYGHYHFKGQRTWCDNCGQDDPVIVERFRVPKRWL